MECWCRNAETGLASPSPECRDSALGSASPPAPSGCWYPAPSASAQHDALSWPGGSSVKQVQMHWWESLARTPGPGLIRMAVLSLQHPSCSQPGPGQTSRMFLSLSGLLFPTCQDPGSQRCGRGGHAAGALSCCDK